MAKDFEVIQRQIGEASVRIPDGSAFETLQRSLGGAQNVVGKIGEDIAVDKAALEGAKQRSEGKKPKLAPGVNRATATFNQSYRNMDLNMSYADGSSMLDEGMSNATAPGVLSPISFQNYMTYSDDAIKATLEGADPSNRPELAFRLKLKSANNELKIKDSLEKKIFDDQSKLASASLLKLNKDLTNAYLSGNEELASDLKSQILDEISSQKNLGYLNPLQEFIAKNAVDEAAIQAKYKGLGESDALEGPGVSEANLAAIIKAKPEDLKLTPEEHDLAIEAYAQGSSSFNSKLQQQKAINYSAVIDQIESRDEAGQRNGLIQTYEDLDQFASNPANPLTALQYFEAKRALRKQILADIKGNNKAGMFWQKAQAGGGVQDLTTKEERSEGWQQGLLAYRDARRTELNDPNYELTPEDEAQLAIQANTPIEQVTTRLNYSFEHADIEAELGNIQWALGFTQKVGGKAPNALSKLTPKSRAIMNATQEAMLYSAQPDLKKIVEGARLSANPDSPTLEARLKAMSGRTQKELLNDFESIFGGKASTQGMEFGAFMNELAIYMPISESYDAALKSVGQQLIPSFGVDANYGEKGKVQYLPPNKTVPYSDTSYFYKNQVNFKLEAALERNYNSDDVDPLDKVEWTGKKMLDTEHSQDSVYRYDLYQQYAKEGPTAGAPIETKHKGKWRGMDVEMFLEADKFSRIQDNNKIKRRVYFRSPGTNEKIYIKDPGNVPGKDTVTDGTGFLVIYDDQLSQMLPNAYEQVTEDNFESYLNRTVEKEFKESGKSSSIPIYNALFPGRKFIKENKPKIAKKLKQFEQKTETQKGEPKKPKINIFDALDLNKRSSATLDDSTLLNNEDSEE